MDKSKANSARKRSSAERRPVIGWREWVALPQLGIQRIKAKVDTGACSSSLHATNIERFERHGVNWVRFDLLPVQRSSRLAVRTEMPVLEFRPVRSSTGHVTERPVILVEIELMNARWPIEVTLASRHKMGFRMLLGREALRGRFLVDSGGSFYAGR